MCHVRRVFYVILFQVKPSEAKNVGYMLLQRVVRINRGDWFVNIFCSCCYFIYYDGILCLGFVDHDAVIKWKYFPRFLSLCTGNSQSHRGQWCGALMFSLICAWINGWVNIREAGDLRYHRAYYDFTVMPPPCLVCKRSCLLSPQIAWNYFTAKLNIVRPFLFLAVYRKSYASNFL